MERKGAGEEGKTRGEKRNLPSEGEAKEREREREKQKRSKEDGTNKGEKKAHLGVGGRGPRKLPFFYRALCPLLLTPASSPPPQFHLSHSRSRFPQGLNVPPPVSQSAPPIRRESKFPAKKEEKNHQPSSSPPARPSKRWRGGGGGRKVF